MNITISHTLSSEDLRDIVMNNDCSALLEFIVALDEAHEEWDFTCKLIGHFKALEAEMMEECECGPTEPKKDRTMTFSINPMAIKASLQDAVFSAIEGNAKPDEVYGGLKMLEKAIEELLKDPQFRRAAVAAVELYGKEGADHFGFHLTTKNLPGQWDFKGVTRWVELKEEMKKVEAIAKSSAQTGSKAADEDDVYIEAAKYTPGGVGVNCSEIKT